MGEAWRVGRVGNRPRRSLRGRWAVEVASTESWDLGDRAPGLEVDVRERRSRMCRGTLLRKCHPHTDSVLGTCLRVALDLSAKPPVWARGWGWQAGADLRVSIRL